MLTGIQHETNQYKAALRDLQRLRSHKQTAQIAEANNCGFTAASTDATAVNPEATANSTNCTRKYRNDYHVKGKPLAD